MTCYQWRAQGGGMMGDISPPPWAHIVAKVFSISMPLSRQLQTENIDLVLALQLANDVRTVFQDLRRDSSEGFSNEFKKIEEWTSGVKLKIWILIFIS